MPILKCIYIGGYAVLTVDDLKGEIRGQDSDVLPNAFVASNLETNTWLTFSAKE
jgi:hypothetical protein